MGDNDFPTVMANGGKSFVDGYIRRKNLYSQSVQIFLLFS